jgi:hypothetical protein
MSATCAKTALRGRNRREGFLRIDDLQASQGDPYTSYITPVGKLYFELACLKMEWKASICWRHYNLLGRQPKNFGSI